MIITDRMTIEEIMVLFNEEYGDDFNWHLIPFSVIQMMMFYSYLKMVAGVYII